MGGTVAAVGIEEQITRTSAADSIHRTIKDHFNLLVSTIEVVVDFVTVMLSALLAKELYERLPVGRHIHYSFSTVLTVAAIFAVVVVFLLDHEGEYEWGDSLLGIRETERVLRVSSQCGIVLFALSFLLAHPFSRWLTLIAMFIMASGLILQKHALRFLNGMFHERGFGIHPVLIYGAGYTGRRVASALFRSAKLGFVPVCMVDDSPSMAGTEVTNAGYVRRQKLTVEEGPLTRERILASGAEIVIVAIPKLPQDKMTFISAEAEASGVRLAFVPNNAASDSWIDYADIDGVMLSFMGFPAPPFGYEFFKRAIDFVVSLAALVALSPAMLLIGALVKLGSSGPALFTQERVGKNGKLFHILKFRTMYSETARYDYSPLEASDRRITKIGTWLRRSSLDELPQLINVLKGDMALVGPRPEMPFIVEKCYEAREQRRLAVLPGITGLWQLSADRAFQIHENIYYDLYYICNRNMFMDIAVLLHTLAFAMRGV